MKLVSWNVNGLRACVTKGFMDYYDESQADIFCLQETKLQAGQIEMDLGEDVYQYWNYAVKKGYSGTAIFTRIKPLSVWYGIEEDSEPEGRMITLEFDHFYLINVYTPNAKRDLTRLPYRLEWEDRFREYVLQLEQTKPVIMCGDLNVAHQEIDLKNPKSNLGNSGFTLEERAKMTDLLAAGYVDSFRHLYPDRTDVYSWWSYMPKVRERNVGWRIDYFLVSNQLTSKVKDAHIDCL
ncbi:exodeoxyribonuclease III [Paenibacillus sp. 1A_MP2]|uniref:exodeoxyribonuclease III n=1 Tax=Paenibacillus sp. 1A_MP2 TaxID=3457495 RepID=UPI003FCCDFDF